jgi:hypothetical protein
MLSLIDQYANVVVTKLLGIVFSIYSGIVAHGSLSSTAT